MSKEILRRDRRRSDKRKHFVRRAVIVLVAAVAALGWAGALMMR
jgi:hypothetical protein